MVHNLTELFIYPGIALLLVPLLNVFYAFILLVLISIYDAYAVWKSKHMVTMAKFAKSSNLFPGLAISYDSKSGDIVKKNINKKNKSRKSKEVRSGILGGGDIAFPLIFSSVFLVSLIQGGLHFLWALFFSFLVSLFSAAALFLLFIFGKRDKYYPAMPFISAGVFVGYFFVLFLLLFF